MHKWTTNRRSARFEVFLLVILFRNVGILDWNILLLSLIVIIPWADVLWWRESWSNGFHEDAMLPCCGNITKSRARWLTAIHHHFSFPSSLSLSLYRLPSQTDSWLSIIITLLVTVCYLPLRLHSPVSAYRRYHSFTCVWHCSSVVCLALSVAPKGWTQRNKGSTSHLIMILNVVFPKASTIY